MKTRIAILTTALLLIAWLVPPLVHRALRLCPLRPEPIRTSSALPSFSRKYGYSCTQCHSAYPLLNDFGRRFKLNGYSLGEEGVMQSQDKELWTEKYFPLGLILRGRPFDNGRGTVSNMGGWNGSSDGSNGFKMQPVNDVDLFVAGGDVARHVSWIGEIDANAGGSFSPGSGDMQLGWHPDQKFNILLARKNFYAMEPYQTLSGMEQPTLAVRATDGMLPDQNGLSGNILTEQTQTMAVSGQFEREKLGALFYMAGVSTSNNDNLGKTAKNGNLRLAFDSGKGVVVGGFGSYGHETPNNIPANGGAANNSVLANGNIGTGTQAYFTKTGVDLLVEKGDLTARAAFLYSYDSVKQAYDRRLDPLGLDGQIGGYSMRDRAAYAELMYVVKRHGSDTPLLLPLVRENWYTTYNGTRQFNYVTFHLAHYFKSNVKVFGEYSVDTKVSDQGLPNKNTLGPTAAAQVPLRRGSRGSLQFEVAF